MSRRRPVELVTVTLAATIIAGLLFRSAPVTASRLLSDLELGTPTVADAPPIRGEVAPELAPEPEAFGKGAMAPARPTVIATVHAMLAAGQSGASAGREATTGGTMYGGPWQWPLRGEITQSFSSSHAGIDILGATGDLVVAAHAGKVIGVGYLTACGGLQVHVDLGGGVENWYQHLSATLVHVGDVIARGARIARVGSSGCATGPHLHFGVRIDGTFVNPLMYLPAP